MVPPINPIRTLREHLFSPVIQFSLPRTGSTVVWNALRAMLPGTKVPKRHDLSFLSRSPFCRSKIVCTVRHPADIICSMLGVSELEPTPEAVAGKIRELRDHGLPDLLAIRHRPGTLFLRYEEFYEDFDALFDRLGDFLGVEADAQTRAEFRERFDIRKVRERSESLGGFGNFDTTDHIHGRHVSEHSGRPGYHTGVLDEALIRLIRSELKEIHDEFGYL